MREADLLQRSDTEFHRRGLQALAARLREVRNEVARDDWLLRGDDMICPKCAVCQHEECYDVVHQTDYRGCDCQHRQDELRIKDEPTGDPTDC